MTKSSAPSTAFPYHLDQQVGYKGTTATIIYIASDGYLLLDLSNATSDDDRYEWADPRRVKPRRKKQ